MARAASAAFGRGDLGALRTQFFAENMTWHIAGTGMLAGDYAGVAQVMELLGRISELTGGTVRPELHDVLVSDDHTVVLATGRAERAAVADRGRPQVGDGPPYLRDRVLHFVARFGQQLDAVGAGHQPQFGGSDCGAAVVVRVQREDDVLAVVQVPAHPLDRVGVDVGRRHLHRARQVEDDLVVRAGAPGGGDRIAALAGEIEFGGAEGLRAVFEHPLGFWLGVG